MITQAQAMGMQVASNFFDNYRQPWLLIGMVTVQPPVNSLSASGLKATMKTLLS
jgi:hypothetical protein